MFESVFIVHLEGQHSLPKYLLRRPTGERLIYDPDLRREHDVDYGSGLTDYEELFARGFNEVDAHLAIEAFSAAIANDGRELSSVSISLVRIGRPASRKLLPDQHSLLRILPLRSELYGDPISLDGISCAWPSGRADGRRRSDNRVFYRRDVPTSATSCAQMRALRTLPSGQQNCISSRYGLKAFAACRISEERPERFPFYERRWCESFDEGWNLAEAATRALSLTEAQILAAASSRDARLSELQVEALSIPEMACMGDLSGRPSSMEPAYADATPESVEEYGFPWHFVVWQESGRPDFAADLEAR